MSEPLEADRQEKMTIEGDVAAASVTGAEAAKASEGTRDTAVTITANTSDQSNTTTSHNSNDNNGNSNPNNPFWKPRAPPMMGPDGKPLSRNATKKLLKQQQFLERRPQMRAQEKLKRKQKDQKRREAIDAGKMICAVFYFLLARHALHLGFRRMKFGGIKTLKFRLVLLTIGLIAPPPKRQKLDQIQSGITIGIDMAFDDYMLEKVPAESIQSVTKSSSKILGQVD